MTWVMVLLAVWGLVAGGFILMVRVGAKADAAFDREPEGEAEPTPIAPQRFAHLALVRERGVTAQR